MSKRLTDGMIFITGMVRSGTSYATHFVANTLGRRLAAQPFPLLYVETMRRFHQWSGRSSIEYPLSDCAFENAYPHAELVRFLTDLRVTETDLKSILERNRQFSGQQTHVVLNEMLEPDTSSNGFDALLSQLLRNVEFENVRGFTGSKETTCEEFLPFLIHRGWFTMIIIRDIRNVICSLNFGKGEQHTGVPKPTLFNLRQWRKSVAFALELQKFSNCAVLRFEDLLNQPNRTRRKLKTQYEGWARNHGWNPAVSNSRHQPDPINNSSFDSGTVDDQRFRSLLNADMLNFIESLCWPELQVMGYKAVNDEKPEVPNPGDFNDPYEGFRATLSNYRWREARYREELQREQYLRTNDKNPELEHSLVFESVKDKLAEFSVASSREA